MNNLNCGRCGNLNHAGFCNLTACIYPCSTGMGGYINKPMTNADRIRNMTDEELAQFMENRIPFQVYVILGEDRYSSWIDWMQQEAE